MARLIKIAVENAEGGCWTYVQRSAGMLPEDSLHKLLNWFLEQLSFGNLHFTEDKQGDVLSLVIGREAPFDSDADKALEHAQKRLLAVNIAGIFAKGRESGGKAKHTALAKSVVQESTDWGRRNVEFHYAFELCKVLARLNKKTFNLETPPIEDRAPSSVLSYLSESTRCWLYGFHGASVALSRACLEDALKARVNTRKVSPPPVTLEMLIEGARKQGVLDDCMAEVAHVVRKAGNRFLHGDSISETDSRETLDAIRSIAEYLFSE